MENKVTVSWIVHFFSDDDSGTMKVLTDTDDEPPPLPPKVSTSSCHTCIPVFTLTPTVSRM